jgi:hypothetical protein
MQVSGLILTTGLAVKIICHSDVTGTRRQQASADDTLRAHLATMASLPHAFAVLASRD